MNGPLEPDPLLSQSPDRLDMLNGDTFHVLRAAAVDVSVFFLDGFEGIMFPALCLRDIFKSNAMSYVVCGTPAQNTHPGRQEPRQYVS